MAPSCIVGYLSTFGCSDSKYACIEHYCEKAEEGATADTEGVRARRPDRVKGKGK